MFFNCNGFTSVLKETGSYREGSHMPDIHASLSSAPACVLVISSQPAENGQHLARPNSHNWSHRTSHFRRCITRPLLQLAITPVPPISPQTSHVPCDLTDTSRPFIFKIWNLWRLTRALCLRGFPRQSTKAATLLLLSNYGQYQM